MTFKYETQIAPYLVELSEGEIMEFSLFKLTRFVVRHQMFIKQ